MHQALGMLWTYPGRAHTAPNTKCIGNVNSDAACHGTVNSDTICQGAVHPDAACHGICLPGRRYQGIFLLDVTVSGHFPSGRSCVTVFSFWTQLCQGILLLDPATSVHFLSGRSHISANGVRTTRVLAPWSRWLSRDRLSQQILSSHSKHVAVSRHSDSVQFYSLYLIYIYIYYYHTSRGNKGKLANTTRRVELDAMSTMQ